MSDQSPHCDDANELDDGLSNELHTAAIAYYAASEATRTDSSNEARRRLGDAHAKLIEVALRVGQEPARGKVPAFVIESCVNEYMLRRAEGRFGYDSDDHRQAFVRGYVACAVTYASGVEGEVETEDEETPMVVHQCCGCACNVCANGHSSGRHADECRERFDRLYGRVGDPIAHASPSNLAEARLLIRKMQQRLLRMAR